MSKLTETEQTFLLAFFKKTNGDATVQVSMYDIGESMGLDRPGSSRMAEKLIGWDLAEVRTLSGGIVITEDGLAEARNLGGDRAPAGSDGFVLPEAPVMDGDSITAVEAEMNELKGRMAGLGLDFDIMSEIMTDTKCLEIQLTSPRPKTAVIRECLRSVKKVLQNAGEKEAAGKISGLLGEHP